MIQSRAFANFTTGEWKVNGINEVSHHCASLLDLLVLGLQGINLLLLFLQLLLHLFVGGRVTLGSQVGQLWAVEIDYVVARLVEVLEIIWNTGSVHTGRDWE